MSNDVSPMTSRSFRIIFLTRRARGLNIIRRRHSQRIPIRRGIDLRKQKYGAGRKNAMNVGRTITKNGLTGPDVLWLAIYLTKNFYETRATFANRSPGKNDIFSHTVRHREEVTPQEMIHLVFGAIDSHRTTRYQEYPFVMKRFCDVTTNMAIATQ